MRDRRATASGVHARYLIAADGVRSTVRSALGIPASRSEDLGERLCVLFRAPLWELIGDRRYAIYFITAAESGARIRTGRSPRPLGVRDEWDSGPDAVEPLTTRGDRLIREAPAIPTSSRIERVGVRVLRHLARALPGRPCLPDR